MARHTGPKNKLARKFGEDLGLKTNPLKLARRLNILPGMHGKKGKKKVSDYGRQLSEKQKVKFMYGILEKQFHKMYEVATKTPSATGLALLRILERRLDNVIYRLGFAPTRPAARQLVAHGNVIVNGKKLSIPSYRVKLEDVVTITDRAMKIPAIADMIKEKKAVPAWLEKKAAVGKVVRYPERNEIDAGINEQLIVEFYSR